MSQEGKWTPGKIFLLVVAILFGLGLLCCGAGWFAFGDKIKAAIAFGTDTEAFKQKLKTEFGPKTAFDLRQAGGDVSFTILVGVDGDLTPERVKDVQDRAWRLFTENFAKNGFFRVEEVGVGHPSARQGGGDMRRVKDWRDHVVSSEELIKRTGLAAPPPLAFLPKQVNVTVTDEDDEETPKEETRVVPKEEKKDDGAGGK